MPSEWQTTTLGELIELKRGYDLPARDRREGSVPIVSSSGVSGYHSEAKVKAPGVVTGRYGTLGEVFFITTDFWPLNTALYVRDFKGSDPRFISYFLKTINFLAYSDKAAVPGVNRNHLHSADVRVPPLKEQQAIACILGALDDKIDLNRRMSRTLEAMARALFHDWFVDFGPVRAKAAGQAPAGLADAVAALFPDRLVEVDGRVVPEGWEIGGLGDLTAKYGGLIQTGPFGSQLHASDYVDAGVPSIMPRDIAERRVRMENIVFVAESDAERLSRHRVLPGDIVYSRRGDVERHALIGEHERGWLCGTGCMLVRLGARFPSPLYVSLHLDQPDIRSWISQHAIGATMPNLNTSVLNQVPVLMPHDDILAAFDRIATPLDSQSVTNDRESQTLAALRDTLLPKLISGELRVPDAERIVGRCL